MQDLSGAYHEDVRTGTPKKYSYMIQHPRANKAWHVRLHIANIHVIQAEAEQKKSDLEALAKQVRMFGFFNDVSS
jgi:hypothetical protein